MKTTNRAHHKGGKNRSVPQAWTPNTISLIFISEKEGKEIAGIDLKPGEFAAIQKDAATRKETLPAWLCRTVDETPALRTVPRGTNKPTLPTDDDAKYGVLLRDIECASDQAAAMLTLLSFFSDLQSRDGHLGDDLSGQMANGIAQLVINTRNNLNAANRALDAVRLRLLAVGRAS